MSSQRQLLLLVNSSIQSTFLLCRSNQHSSSFEFKSFLLLIRHTLTDPRILLRIDPAASSTCSIHRHEADHRHAADPLVGIHRRSRLLLRTLAPSIFRIDLSQHRFHPSPLIDRHRSSIFVLRFHRNEPTFTSIDTQPILIDRRRSRGSLSPGATAVDPSSPLSFVSGDNF